MRFAFFSLAVVAAGVAVYVLRGGDSAPRVSAGAVSLVGDSLNVGIERYLPDELTGWRIQNHNEVGRATWQGVELVREQRERLARRLVVSLGTNDPAGDASGFATNVREVLAAAGPDRCVVWVTIHREGHAAFNDALRREAEQRRNLFLVDWAAMVRDHPEWLAGDGIHATEAGYAKRAAAVAQAVEACRLVRVEPA